MQMRVVVESLIWRRLFGSYMSISSQSMSNCSSTFAIRSAPSVLKWKLRSRLMSMSSPTASRNVPMSFSTCGMSHLGAIWSVEPMPPLKPPPNVAFWPGKMMLVFSAVKPRSLTSCPRSVMDCQESMGGTPRMS